MLPAKRTLRVAAFALAAALSCGAVMAQTPAATDDDTGDSSGARTSGAFVAVSALPRGDVRIEILGRDFAPAQVASLVRSSLRCDWRSEEDGGVCQKYLPTNGMHVEGALALAPLVRALHAAGVDYVSISLTADGAPARGKDTLSSWTKLELPKTATRRSSRLLNNRYSFLSIKADQLPPAFTVSMGEKWQPLRLAGRLLFVIAGPALLALWIRRRDRRRGDTSIAIVWLNWILLGSWLYWISSMSLADIVGFAVQIPIDSSIFSLVVGTAIYSLPPLTAMALASLILMPPVEEGQGAGVSRAVRMAAREGVVIVPLGMFLVGSYLFDRNRTVGMISMPAAYLLYRVLQQWVARTHMKQIRALDGGGLYRRMGEIAAASGAKLKGAFVLPTRSAHEVNAYATSTGCIVVARGLVERLTRREVDAVLAHEAGHLSGKHIGYRSMLFWAYLILVIPASSLLGRTGLPGWALSLPILPMLYVIAVAQLSQRHEYDADRRAAAITGDPEAMIAALARLRKVTRSPLSWGGIQGSILSHPSMKQRVLAIARASGLPPERALAILNDPDTIAPALPSAEAVPEHYDLPPEMDGADPVYSVMAREGWAFWSTWGTHAGLVLLMAALALLSNRIVGGAARGVALYFACVPLGAWLFLKLGDAGDRLFRKLLKPSIARRLQPEPGALLVGLTPGSRVAPFGGTQDWDMGYLALTPGWFRYHGERTQFSIPSGDILGLSVEKGQQVAWDPTYGLVVRHSGGEFVLRECDAPCTRQRVRKLQERIDRWRLGAAPLETDAAMENAAAGSVYPHPQLPPLRPAPWNRWTMARFLAFRTAGIFFGTLIVLATAVPMTRSTTPLALVPFGAALAYAVAVSPYLFRRREAAA